MLVLMNILLGCILMGIIGGMGRGPKRPPRLRRAANKLALGAPGDTTVHANIRLGTIFSGDSADLPSGVDGDMILFYDDTGATLNIAVYWGGWYTVGVSTV